MAKERSGIHLIAQMAGVSIATDRALHGRGGIKESTPQSILQRDKQTGTSRAKWQTRRLPCLLKQEKQRVASKFHFGPGGPGVWATYP